MKSGFLGLLLAALIGGAGSVRAEEERWFVLRSGTAQKPHILSVRPSLPAEAVRAAYPVEVTLRWEYGPNETGLPAEEAELNALYAFETSLRTRDPKARMYMDAVRSSGDGARTWIFFSTSEEAFRNLLDKEGRVTVSYARDPSWSALTEILSRIRQ